MRCTRLLCVLFLNWHYLRIIRQYIFLCSGNSIVPKDNSVTLFSTLTLSSKNNENNIYGKNETCILCIKLMTRFQRLFLNSSTKEQMHSAFGWHLYDWFSSDFDDLTYIYIVHFFSCNMVSLKNLVICASYIYIISIYVIYRYDIYIYNCMLVRNSKV